MKILDMFILIQKEDCIMFHRHRWERVGRVHTAPARQLTKVDNSTESMVLKLVFGITNITLRCQCGDEKVVAAIGEVV